MSEMKETFRQDLEQLLNRYSIDAYCETPDFILADLICDQLEAIRRMTVRREKWFGRKKKVTIDLDDNPKTEKPIVETTE